MLFVTLRQNSVLFVLWTVGLTVTLLLQIIADAFADQAPVFPLLPVLALCCVLWVALACVPSVVLRQHFGFAFQYYQPFVGGDAYIACQVLGYLAVVVALMIQTSVFVVRPSSDLFGRLTVVGLLMVIGQVMLMLSVDLFEGGPAEGVGFAASQLSPRRVEKKKVLRRDTWVVVLLLVGYHVPVPALAALVPELTKLAMSIFVASHLLCGLLIHVRLGWMLTPGYRLILSWPAGWKFVIAQSLAWAGYFVTLFVAVVLTSAGHVVQPLAISALAAFSALASSCLLLFVRTFRYSSSETSPVTPLTPASVYSRELRFVVQHGRFTLSAAALSSLVVVLFCTILITQIRDPACAWLSDFPELQVLLRHAVASVELYVVRHASDLEAVIDGLWASRAIAMALLVAYPPLTHLLGSLSYPGSFNIWAPFEGPQTYVLLQSLGWCAYSSAVVGAAVLRPYHVSSAIVLFAVLMTAAQVMIHVSIDTFASAGARLHAVQRRYPTNAKMNGEMLTSILFMSSVIVLGIVADLVPSHAMKLPLFLASTILFLAACPLAHVSNKSAPLVSPFSGPAEYVALQAVGWTLYAMSVLTSVIQLTEMDSSTLSGNHDQFAFTRSALLHSIPFSLISLSVFLYQAGDGEAHNTAPPSIALPAPTSPSVGSNKASSDVSALAEELIAGLRRREGPAAAAVIKHLESLCPRPSDSPVTVKGSPRKVPPPLRFTHGSRRPSAFGAGASLPATICVVVLNIATLTLFGGAALLAAQRERYAAALVMTIAGTAAATVSCGALQLLYGPSVYGRIFRPFMPFSGGSSFVALQACGWGTYGSMLLLVALHLLEGSDDWRASPLVAAGAFGVAAQWFILRSIPLFHPTLNTPSTIRISWFEKNAEGCVAVLLFLSTFCFLQVYNFGRTVEAPLSPLSILVSVTSMIMALPLSAVALRKSQRPAFSPRHHGHSTTTTNALKTSGLSLSALDDIETTPTYRPLWMVEYVALPAMLLVPLGLLHAWYYTSHELVEYASVVLNFSLYTFYFMIGLTMFAIVTRSVQTQFLVDLRVSITAASIYMIPTFIVVPSYLISVLLPLRGSYGWSVIITLFTLIPPPYNRKILRPLIAATAGFVLYETLPQSVGGMLDLDSQCPSLNVDDGDTTTFWRCTAVVLATQAYDFGVLLFWFVYGSTYKGNPEEYGFRRREGFVQWMKRHFYDDAARYFRLRVVADPSIKGALRDPKKQYIFSFHPHGVFPATAVYGIETDPWRNEMGFNDVTRVTVHGATIIFSGPLLRDFCMNAGVRSVTRRSLERSLSEGNSVTIVTGGQAEMLLTAAQSKSLHLITYHLGFLRLAIQQRVPLVPVLSLGEQNILDTVHCYKVQKWFLKRIGFPFPLLPMGAFGLPVPNRTPVLVAVGRPIEIPAGLSPDDKQGVQALADQYFAELRRLYQERCAEAGMGDVELVLHSRLPDCDPHKEHELKFPKAPQQVCEMFQAKTKKAATKPTSPKGIQKSQNAKVTKAMD